MKLPLNYELKAGDIIAYIYNGELDYSKWLGDGTHMLVSKPPTGSLVIKGVWKKDEFHPRSILKIK